MKPVVKKVLVGVVAVLGLAGLGSGGFVYANVSAFDSSMAKVYDTPPLAITRSQDPAIVARGKHLVEATSSCAAQDCHGKDLAGGKSMVMGPLGTITGPNITPGGTQAAYSDGELARLIRFGIKKDGRSATFMPSYEFNWMNDQELTALISYLRTVPSADKPNGPVKLGTLAKILDRHDKLGMDVARKVAGKPIVLAGAPAPTAEYGAFLAKGCTGCHGDTLSGGPIPGAPSDLPVPLNITPDATGIKGWTYEDFDKLVTKGDRKNGQKLKPFMPIENLGQMDETEKKALFAHLMSLSPKPFGGR